jgi:hypothetical protein
MGEQGVMAISEEFYHTLSSVMAEVADFLCVLHSS